MPATTSPLASPSPLIASTTSAAVLEGAPAASVPSMTMMPLPTTLTLRGEFAARGVRNSAEIMLPPSCPHAREVSTTARSSAPWTSSSTSSPGSIVPAIVACARRW